MSKLRDDLGMRIGTWNMDGRRGDRSRTFLLARDCDVLLLTEVPVDLELEGYELAADSEVMVPGRRWAAIASRTPLKPCAVPHPASAAAIVEGVTYVSSVLPWAGSGGAPPWDGPDHAARTANALAALAPFLREQPELVWGGDWNHSLVDREHAGSNAGRARLLALLEELGLAVPTRELPHRLAGVYSIDHIAIRRTGAEARHVPAIDADGALSDHDFYAVEY